MNELESLVDQTRLLFHQLVRTGERLHEAEPVTLGMRAVLEYLTKNGPSTVPEIARRRGVSRQHIQMLVNPLLEQGLVRLRDNPAHRRSSLVILTAAGEKTIARIQQREARHFERIGSKLSATQLRKAAETLSALRRSLEEIER